MRREPSKQVMEGSICPRCRTRDVQILRTEGGFEYRQCRRAVCKQRFHVAIVLPGLSAVKPEKPPSSNG
jgi:hypothetical protein